MIDAPPASRLARSLGPLGLIGSLLLHGAVLAALLERPDSPIPKTLPQSPMVFRVTIAVAADPVAPPGPPAPEPTSTRSENAPAPPAALAPEPPPAVVAPKRPRPIARPAAKPVPPRSAAPIDTAAETPAMTIASSPAPQALPDAPPGPPPAPVHITHIRARDHNPPIYPDRARRDELEGTVWLKLAVSPSGRVETVTLLRSSGHRILDDAALSAARLWQLYPAEQDGRPVAGWAEVEIPFRLTD